LVFESSLSDKLGGAYTVIDFGLDFREMPLQL
jgi:hypothetical protein